MSRLPPTLKSQTSYYPHNWKFRCRREIIFLKLDLFILAYNQSFFKLVYYFLCISFSTKDKFLVKHWINFSWADPVSAVNAFQCVHLDFHGFRHYWAFSPLTASFTLGSLSSLVRVNPFMVNHFGSKCSLLWYLCTSCVFFCPTICGSPGIHWTKCCCSVAILSCASFTVSLLFWSPLGFFNGINSLLTCLVIEALSSLESSKYP